MASSDAFCGSCGKRLLLLESRAGQRGTPPSTLQAEERGSPTPATRRRSAARWFGLSAAILYAVLAAAGIVLLLLAWRSESGDRRALERSLSDARQRISHLEQERDQLTADLKRTKGELAQSEQLSAERAGVLARTRQVLRKVDPLLSSVDELQQLTGTIQSERDNFAGLSASLTNDLIDLANYLLDVDPYYIDYDYLGGQIDYINGELGSVRAAASTLSSYDDDYGKASRRFGRRADDYTGAVRRLQRQLARVAG